jgi:hypothetical protein
VHETGLVSAGRDVCGLGEVNDDENDQCMDLDNSRSDLHSAGEGTD